MLSFTVKKDRFEEKKSVLALYAKVYNTGVGKNMIYFPGNPSLTQPDLN